MNYISCPNFSRKM